MKNKDHTNYYTVKHVFELRSIYLHFAEIANTITGVRALLSNLFIKLNNTSISSYKNMFLMYLICLTKEKERCAPRDQYN